MLEAPSFASASREFDDARREIREETARIMAMQKQALIPVQNALRTVEKTRQADAIDRDELKNAAMIQRQYRLKSAVLIG